ncbi:DUF2325 domain-containing protein [Geosporobacter ferrireducens]|uniref:Dihydroorotate dehydrogenase n=1 Tax=Geosporobacter ferrireducens TaxID=1424294 RepID=A0A1D8GPJ3_9FIRM|nr:DUF2325 domain-containing protein [Geosporobacter ferrireducens]AOT72832.1 hypothetical protein Gferi_26700 [Geosporobacter ferrireducens]MTI55230.1 DUF2325 domain-containing protein [Geosporobacter ferrireducens]
MTALIVGGDKLGNIPDVLTERGIQEYIHWPGRKKGMRKKSIPTNIDMVIVLVDYIEHNLTEIIKEQSKTMNIPCVFSKRACSDLAMKLDNCKNCKLCKIS